MVDTTVMMAIIGLNLLILVFVALGAIKYVPAALNVEEPEDHDHDTA